MPRMVILAGACAMLAILFGFMVAAVAYRAGATAGRRQAQRMGPAEPTYVRGVAYGHTPGPVTHG